MEILFLIFLIAMAILGICMSLYLLLMNQPEEGRKISLQRFVVLILVYATVMAGFGLIYLVLELMGLPILMEDNKMHHETYFHLVEDVLYFSAVTLMTVGYGDITPQGIGRWIAMVQALIGYLLPAAFVVTAVFYREKKPERL